MLGGWAFYSKPKLTECNLPAKWAEQNAFYCHDDVPLMQSATIGSATTSVPTSALTPAPPLLGGYQPIKDVKDPHIEDIGKWAVEEYKKQHHIKSIFEFKDVVSGESAVVTGIKYRLIVIVRSGGLILRYQTIVWEKAWEHFRQLGSFKLYNH
ncbi:unnamed protein product [Citrullus colocynthis]|uniref:Cystatin domain-containing protein n=1 Tax=Citrullus colocynthis TaxID=252529 RepID=A0ABP0XU85_9ROSI